MEDTEEAEGLEYEGWGRTIPQKVAIGFGLSFIPLLSMLGNLLVCVAVFTYEKLKQINNYFLVSLAVADMLVAVLVMTFAITNDVLGRWLFGSVWCWMWISIDIMCSTASILNLCLICVDRYLHLQDPFQYISWMTLQRALSYIAVVWVISAFIAFVPNSLGWGQQSTPDEGHCFMDLVPLFALVSASISFYIPCVAMIFIYCKVYLFVRFHRKNIMNIPLSLPSQSNPNTYLAVKAVMSEYKAEITLGVVIGVFLICWLPFFINSPLMAYCSECSSVLIFQIFTWLGYLNSCLNPFIYSAFNSQFREAFNHMFFRKCCSQSARRLIGRPESEALRSTQIAQKSSQTVESSRETEDWG